MMDVRERCLVLLSSEGIEPIKDGHELVVIVLRATTGSRVGRRG
jgi:hypothetical protein